MIEELYEFGKYIIETEGSIDVFKEDWQSPRVSGKNKENILEIKLKNGGLTSKKIDTANLSFNHSFYYKGGNPSVTGTTGIQGISPFFIMVKNLDETKLMRSNAYQELYEKEFSDDVIESYLEYLKTNLDKLKKEINKYNKADNIVYLYISEFKGQSMEKIHKYFFTQFSKSLRNKGIEDNKGVCELCEKETLIRYPNILFYSLDKPTFSINYQKNSVEASRLQICIDCEFYVNAGWKYLKSKFNSFVLIPVAETIENNINYQIYEEFLKIIDRNDNQLRSLISVLNQEFIYKDKLHLIFVVYHKEQSALVIDQIIPNFQMHIKEFQNVLLIENGEYKFVPHEVERDSNLEIKHFFNIEWEIKSYIVDNKNKILISPFYRIYLDGLPGTIPQTIKKSVIRNLNELFHLIYNTKFDPNIENIVKDLTITYILFQIRNKREFYGEFEKEYLVIGSNILRRINFYYFIRQLLLKNEGEKTLKEHIEKLKPLFQQIEQDDDEEDGSKEFDQEIAEKVINYINKVDSIPLYYYLLGSFIRKIDKMRYHDGQKSPIFESFISSLNKQNMKRRFSKDILQHQIMYIHKMSKTSKLFFEAISSWLDKLFEYDHFDDAIIALTTGYYAKTQLL